MKTEEKGEKEGGRFSAYKIRWCTSQKKSQVEGVKDLKNNVLLFFAETLNKQLVLRHHWCYLNELIGANDLKW